MSEFDSRPEHTYKRTANADYSNSLPEFLHAVSAHVSVCSQLHLVMPAKLKVYPYKLARLIIPAPTSKDQRWVIKYYAYDVTAGKVTMHRDLSINAIQDHKQRKARAQYIIKEINAALKAGKVYDPQKALIIKTQAAMRDGSVTNTHLAIEAFLASRKSLRKRTYDTYLNHIGKFREYIIEQKLINAPITAVTASVVELFLLQLIRDGKSARTHNNYLNSISTLFDYFKRKEIIAVNPCERIEPIKTSNGKNIAYLPHQQKELLDYSKKHHPQLYLVSQFMYYTLARTNELASMRVGDIDLANKKIYLRSEDSKNREQRHITIPPQLYKIIQQSGIMDAPAQHYIFSGLQFTPGTRRADTKRIGQFYRERILNKLKYPSGYTLYSWKHTGVISAYRAGLSRAAIRMQTGHKSSQSFEAYLFSLGLFENTEVLNNYPSLPE